MAKVTISLPMALISGLILLGLGAGAGAGLVLLYQQRGAAPDELAGNGPAAVSSQFPPKLFGKWALTCVLPQTGKKTCGLILNAANPAGRVALRLTVTLGDGGKPMLTIGTPPNATLANGVTLTPDKGAPQKFAFTVCGPGACRAVTALDEDLANAFSRSKSVTAAYTGGGGRTISYPLPVDGFADGLAALKAA